ncbi:response regulator [Oxalobacteraceae sp. CFBP 8763]|nr:response regulator [Oxalobacteraceae sp. CFBP 8763]
MRRRYVEFAMLATALVFLGASLAYLQLTEVGRLESSERARLLSLTTLLASNIQTDLVATNVALEGVVRDYLSAPDGTVADAELAGRLSALVGAMPGLRTLMVFDRDARVRAASQHDLYGQDFSRRDYMTAVRRAPSSRTLYVAEPFRSIRGDQVVTVARMVPDATGRFAGMVLATLDPEYFTGQFRTAMYAPDVWAVVVHGGGRQLLNYPPKGKIDGTNLARPGTFYQRHRSSGRVASVLEGRVYTTGEERVMAMATIAPAALAMDYPLVIGLSRDAAAVAAPLRRQAMTLTALFAVLVIGACGALAVVQRRRAQWARQDAEQARARAAMQGVYDSEARFRTLIEDAPLAIAILRHGRFIYSNPRYRALHGYGATDDLTGLRWRAMITAPSLAGLAQHEALIEADTPAEQHFEAIGLGKWGSSVPVYKTTAQVRLADGPATLVFAQDISAQKSAEAEMLLARDAAEAASRSKAEFLANMSHEIRSPLNAVLGFAYLLEQRAIDADARSMVRNIRVSGQSLLAIVNDILDVSKIEAGHMLIETAPFCLGELLEKVATSMRISAAGKDLQLIVDTPPAGVGILLGDALRLEQVLLNLTGNAVKFTPNGQVALHCTLLRRDGDGDALVLQFSVHDTGIGIDPAAQESIFSPFTQADSSTTRRFGGTGLGLTICRQLVALMGGALIVDSAPGRGSVFSFSLPLQATSDAGATAVCAAVPPSGQTLRDLCVLVVDDSDINREVVQRILRDQGAETVCVGDGRQALDWLLAHPEQADVVLMDVQMPVMDGIEATRQLRRMPQFDGLPVIALTAGAFKEQQEAALEAGMCHVLSKPFDVPAMLALIARLCGSEGGGEGGGAGALAGPAPAQVDDDVLDVAAGLALWLDGAAYRQYLAQFLDLHGDSAALIGASLAAGRPGEAAALAHKLAGVAASLALPATRVAAHEAERMLYAAMRDPGADGVAVDLAPLTQVLAQARRAIEQYLGPAPAPAASPMAASPAVLHAHLTSLLEALDAEALEQAEACLAALGPLMPAVTLDRVWNPLRRFDFRAAEAAVRLLTASVPATS